MIAKLDWNADGRDWPQRAESRFIEAGGLRWRVAMMGEGPLALLVHGTGASAHSWRDVAPRLATQLTVVAPDLPGHGFTQTPPSQALGLPAMAESLAALMEVLALVPTVIVGHSAGAAVALRMAADGRTSPRAIVAFNGALKPFPGAAGHVFPMLARLLFVNPFAPYLFAMQANRPGAVERLIRQIGSHLDERGLRLYERLFRSPGHIAAALGMMAAWDLAPLQADLARVSAHVTLLTAGKDRAVPPSDAAEIAPFIPRGKVVDFGPWGHLAHEEQPDRAVQAVLAALETAHSVSGAG